MTALDPGEAKDTPALFPEELLIGRPLRVGGPRLSARLQAFLDVEVLPNANCAAAIVR